MINLNYMSLRLVKEKGVRYENELMDITKPETVFKIATELLELNEKPEEEFWIICVSVKGKITGMHQVSIGDLSSTIVHPREIYKRAILNNAAGIFLLHNHPSGITTPSREDVDITKRLMECGVILGIKVIDHIIIGNGYTSLRDIGEM